MKRPFELGWLGGAAERRVRKRRPGVDDLPWGTLRAKDYPDALVERARVAWTESAYNEYCTAAAFAAMQGALLAADAPVDLVGMIGDFVADEMVHVELNARMAMELGGGAPFDVDFDDLVRRPRQELSPLQRASELVVRTCCVGEAMSVPLLAATMRAAAHPLTHGVLARIVRDEAPHARAGWLFLEWAAGDLDAGERARLATTAMDALGDYAAYFRPDPPDRERFGVSDVRALGWLEAPAYAEVARRAVRDDVVLPLARAGIVLDPRDVEALVAPHS
jgi:hypothetical protein